MALRRPPRTPASVLPASPGAVGFGAPTRVPVTPAVVAAWKALGFSGPMPTIISRTLPQGVAGEAPFGRIPSKSVVYITPEIAAGLQTLGLTRNRNLGSLAILMHEFTHTRQPMTLNRPTFEGGAEAYTQSHFDDALRRLGIRDYRDFAPGDFEYQPIYRGFVDRMFNRGWEDVNRTQFGRR